MQHDLDSERSSSTQLQSKIADLESQLSQLTASRTRSAVDRDYLKTVLVSFLALGGSRKYQQQSDMIPVLVQLLALSSEEEESIRNSLYASSSIVSSAISMLPFRSTAEAS